MARLIAPCTLFSLLVLYTLFVTAGASTEPQPSSERRRLKILVNNPAVGWSHMQYQGRLADLLTEAGHEVHLLVQDTNPHLLNYTGVTRGQRIRRVQRPPEKRDDFLNIQFMQDIFVGPKNMMLDGSMRQFQLLQMEQCREMVNDAELMAELEAEHYDVGLSELFHPCAFAIFKRVGVRASLGTYAMSMNTWLNHYFGLPTLPSWNHMFLAPTHGIGVEKNFFERAYSLVIETLDGLFLRPRHTAIIQPIFTQAYGEDFPAIDAIMRNISLLFVNSNEFFELPHLTSNKIVYIGGVVQAKVGTLTEREQEILANSQSGVVLFSFGTMADMNQMSREMKLAFIEAFWHFPTYDFIWKHPNVHPNDTDLFATSTNVHTLEWVQQKALLLHPKLKTLITHCGLNSLSEASTAGVPTVGVPLFGDQLYNTALLRSRKTGVYLDIRQATKAEPIVEALREVLHNPVYADNARLLARKLARSPFSPQERFVRWVEFAADYPDLNELNLPYAKMSFFVYYSLDVIGAFIAVAVAIGWLFIRVARRWIGAWSGTGEYHSRKREASGDTQQRSGTGRKAKAA